MFATTWRAGETSTALERARDHLVARRLPLFAFGALGNIVLWGTVLVLERRLGWRETAVVFGVQAAALLGAFLLCRTEYGRCRGRAIALFASIILGLSSVALLANSAAFGEVPAFVLLTLYLMAALLFAWGWQTELVLIATTFVPLVLTFPTVERFVPAPELAAAVAVGAAIALSIAEGGARTFRVSFLNRASEAEMKRELEASHDAYRDLAENARDLIYTVDVDGRFTYVNEALARWIGEPAAAIAGRSVLEVVSDDPRNPDALDVLRRMTEGEAFPPIRYTAHSIRGVRFVETNASVIRDSSGRVTGIRGIGRDVTERTLAEDALRESEERFRSAFDSASIGMAVVDLDGCALQVNDALCEMLGYSTGELRGRSFRDITHADDAAEQTRLIERLIAGDLRHFNLEKRYRHRNGTDVWGLLSTSLVRSQRGEPLYFISQIQDITERKRAEEALRQSEARFRNVFDHAPIGMAIVAPDGRTIQVNRSLCEMLGYSEGELCDRVIQSLTHPDDLRDSIATTRRLLRGEMQSFQLEKRYRQRDGRIVWCLLSASVVRGHGGEPLYVVAQFEDITQRQAAAEALRQSEQRYREVVEAQQEMLMRFDLEGRVTFVNDAACRKLGMPREEIVGSGFLHLIHAGDRAAAVAEIERLKAPPYRSSIENRGATPDGWRWFAWEGCAIRDRAGAVVELQSVGRDVTERRLAEEALHASLSDLRRSEEQLRLLAQRQALIREEERKRLGFDLHDDVCQELVGIAILIASIRQRLSPLPAEAASELDRVMHYLYEVVEHLRLLARELRPMLLRDLGLSGSLRSLAEGMSTTETTIVARVPSTVPRFAEDTEVAVFRIAQEALGNAVRHAGATTIVLSLEVADGALDLEVRDDGRGFTAETRRRSNALGLVSMEERALALGGRFEIASELGRGTAIRLVCPVTPRPEAALAADGEATAANGEPLSATAAGPSPRPPSSRP